MNYYEAPHEETKTILGEIEAELYQSVRVREQFFTTAGSKGGRIVSGGNGSIIDECDGIRCQSIDGRPEGNDFREDAPPGGFTDENVLAMILSGDLVNGRKGLVFLMFDHGAQKIENLLKLQIREHPGTVGTENIRKFARQCILKGTDEDDVITGLLLFQELPDPDPEIRHAVMNLALYDRMTSRAVQVIRRQWGEAANEALFQIGTHIDPDSWQKVFPYVQADTEEIAGWFLGRYAYSLNMDKKKAAMVAEKSHLTKALEGTMTMGEYDAAGVIIQTLLYWEDEVPDREEWVRDEEGRPCGRRLLLNYLKKAEDAFLVLPAGYLRIQMWQTILSICLKADSFFKCPEVREEAMKLLKTEEGIAFLDDKCDGEGEGREILELMHRIGAPVTREIMEADGWTYEGSGWYSKEDEEGFHRRKGNYEEITPDILDEADEDEGTET